MGTFRTLLRQVGFALSLSAGLWANEKKRIALSFDDAPRGDSAIMTGEQRTSQLLLQLQTQKAPQVMFFVNSDKITPRTLKRLESYAEAGHLLAHHGHAHVDAHRISLAEWILDFDKGTRLMSQLLGFRRFYRFPFLRSGGDHRDAMRLHYENAGFRHGYVTIDTYDYYMDFLLQKAHLDGQHFHMHRAQQAFVKMILDGVRFYDDIAVQALGRSPAHVLLLHENDLVAWSIGDLILALRAEGWEIIPVAEAYRDPIANTRARSLIESQGHVAALALDAAYSGPIVSRYESEFAVDEEFRLSEVFGTATAR